MQTNLQAEEKVKFSTEVKEGIPVYYVAEEGKDSALGTEGSPLATLKEALTRVNPGAGGVIRILPGALRERVVIDYQATEDRPLIIEGAINSDEKKLSAIDGSHHLESDKWERRSDLGPGVYSYPYQESDPGIVLVNGKMVARLNPDGPHHKVWNDIGDAKEILKWPEDRRVKTIYRSGSMIPFWETLGGVYTPGAEEFYLRLHQEIDPSKQEVAIASLGATVEIKDGSYVTLSNLIVKGSESGISVSGEKSAKNTIENCYIPHGRFRIKVSNGARDTTIRHNLLEMGFIGNQTGAWGGSSINLEEDAKAAQREFMYNYFKYWASKASTSQDWSIRLERDTQSAIIEDNVLDGGLIGIGMYAESGNILIKNNVIRNFSSVGTAFTQGTYRLTYDGNLFANNNINIRPHNLGLKGKRDVYILRNTSLLPEGLGKHFHNHTYSYTDKAGKRATTGKEYLDEHVTIYHNNFIGGTQGIPLGVAPDDDGNTSEEELDLYKFYRVLNNNFINCGAVINPPKAIVEDNTKFGVFDYNLIINSHYNRFGKPAWWGKHNVMKEENGHDWRWDMNGFQAPKDTTEREIGIDLSKPFEINGKKYDALPGLAQKYFSGKRPLTGWPPTIQGVGN